MLVIVVKYLEIKVNTSMMARLIINIYAFNQYLHPSPFESQWMLANYIFDSISRFKTIGLQKIGKYRTPLVNSSDQ